MMALKGELCVFFKKIKDDECEASMPVVSMQNTNEKPEDHDPRASYLLMIPGFDEDSTMFNSIAEKIKIQSVSLQLGPDYHGNSIKQTAYYLWQHVKPRLNCQSEFHILGYSFGVNIALELAALMEEEGNIGVIYCLDSSPDALRVQLETYIGRATAKELQHIVIAHMYHLISGEDSTDLKNDLEHIDSWTGKIDACIKRLKNSTTHSHEYIKSIIKTAYKKILLAREYEPDFKLESELVLLKAVPSSDSDMNNLDKDYNLSKYTKQKVKIFHLTSNHLSATEDNIIPNIINGLLEPELVENYKKKNLCEGYFV